MINISRENKHQYNQNFTSGITRKLSRNYYHSEQDIVKIFDTHLQMYVNRAAAEKFTNEAAEILASDASEAEKRWKLNVAYFYYWVSETVKSKLESLKN